MESCGLPDGRVKSGSNPLIIACSRCDETQSIIEETTRFSPSSCSLVHRADGMPRSFEAPRRPSWVHQLKLDGYRALGIKSVGAVRSKFRIDP
jgi:hypothetical protein